MKVEKIVDEIFCSISSGRFCLLNLRDNRFQLLNNRISSYFDAQIIAGSKRREQAFFLSKLMVYRQTSAALLSAVPLQGSETLRIGFRDCFTWVQYALLGGSFKRGCDGHPSSALHRRG